MDKCGEAVQGKGIRSSRIIQSKHRIWKRGNNLLMGVRVFQSCLVVSVALSLDHLPFFLHLLWCWPPCVFFIPTMPYSPVMIPEISISPAPPMEHTAEPYSPFSSIKFPDNGDDFRPRLLTPPPSSPIRTRSPSSGGYNSDEERFDYNEGLDKQRFEALLQATRERNTGRAPDLRREVTLKAHNAKQSTWISDVHSWLFTNYAHS